MLITIPIALATAIDLDRVVTSVRYYGDGRFAVGVLTHGTCFFPAPGQPFATELTRLLGKVREQSPDFVIRGMDDRNFVVRFDEYVFAVVFRDDFEQHRAAIQKEASESSASEHSGTLVESAVQRIGNFEADPMRSMASAALADGPGTERLSRKKDPDVGHIGP